MINKTNNFRSTDWPQGHEDKNGRLMKRIKQDL
jgi:hypothetical protein